ncbi:MAG: ATP-binding protein [Defluviicoccus sp.]|nr:ATP-binding protein [Defluviicoccus sp.]
MNDTATIRARIHDSAIKRVTRTFAAGLPDIFTETLQNGRRAGATRVRVAVSGSDGNITVTVTDDGAGIVDPAVLLSFGENGWSEDLVRREDAAGMGMLSLARRGCTVSSRPRAPSGDPAPGWRVELLPAHFLGEAEAEVHPADGAPWPHGTAVTFQASGSEDAERIRRAIEQAARHYPLPVMFEAVPDTPAGGERLDRRAFLDGALHVERWRGLVFGAFKDRWFGFGRNDPDVNFHGLTVSAQLPRVESVTGECWTVGADIVACPELELVLPARKEPVETPFLEEMREAARLAIYRAMAADPDPRPSFADRKRAHEADIDIAPPPPELLPWRPGLADVDDWREPPKREPVGSDALLMACDPEPPEAQALWRAAERAGIAGRMFEPDHRLEGYAWYDAIERIVHIHTEAIVGRRPYALDRYPAPERTGAPGAPLAQRPDAIRMSLTVRPGRGVGRILDLDADVAFAGEAWSWVGDALPLVTAASGIEPFQLMELLRAAFFSASDDADADSWERQRDVFEHEALHIATRLLVSDDAARRSSIADAVTRELFWLIPHDRGADIAVRDRKVTVTLGEPVAGAAS